MKTSSLQVILAMFGLVVAFNASSGLLVLEFCLACDQHRIGEREGLICVLSFDFIVELCEMVAHKINVDGLVRAHEFPFKFLE